MNWQEFEEGLKSGVNNHNSNIDTDQLWNNIQEKKRRKRPFLFWWWTGGALLLTAGTAIAIYFMQYHNVHIKNNITTQELSISTDNITTKNELQRVSTTKLSYDVQPENHNEKNVATTTTTNILHTQASTSVLDPKLGDKRVAPQGSNTAVASTLPVINALSPVRTNKQDASMPNSNPVFNPNILDNAGGINPINKREKGEENTPLAAVTLSLTTASSAELASNTNIVSDHINVPKTVVNTVLATNLLQTEEFPQKNITQSSNFPLLPIRSPLLEAAPKQYDFPWFNPETTKKKQPEQQSFYGGISSGYYRWAAFRAVGVDSVLKSPRTNERNLEAVNLGLQFFLPFHKKWTLSTGVQYESYNSVYNWKNQWVNNSTPTPITTSYINGEQDSTTIYTRTTTTRIVEHYNKITTFAIPLELGYRIQRGKWGIMPFAGVQIALQQRAKGVISSLDNVPQANIYPSIYRRTLVCSAHAGVRIHVALSAKTQLLLSPVARYDLTNRAVGFSERIGAVGLQMGVVRKF
jgi:hypothetical protein